MVHAWRGLRVWAVLAVLAMVAVACSSDKGAAGLGGGDATSTTSVATDGQTAGGPSAPGSTSPGGGGRPTGTAGGGGDDGTTGASGPSTTAATAPAVIGVGSLGVGQAAPPLLRPGRGDRVVLEVRAQAGATPASATIDHLVAVLRSASGKQVVVDGVDALGGGARDWTQREIISAAAGAAQAESGRVQVVLRLLFLRGSYDGDGSILGVAVAGDVAAVFSDRVKDTAGLLVPASEVEDAVAMHEMGHLLALVDILLGSGRGDPDHPGHSRNRRSVMYWQVESDLILQLLDGGIPRDFDADDRAELAQIRNG